VNNCRRGIFYIDRTVQGALLARTAIYWMFWLFSVSLMLICWSAFTGPKTRFVELVAELFDRYGPALLASLLLLPIVMMDVLRLSNRFVGPVSRLRAGLKDLAQGKLVRPLNFRDDDYWRELAVDFNEVAARVNEASKAQTEVVELVS
jgi:hypothetical protein